MIWGSLASALSVSHESHGALRASNEVWDSALPRAAKGLYGLLVYRIGTEVLGTRRQGRAGAGPQLSGRIERLETLFRLH